MENADSRHIKEHKSNWGFVVFDIILFATIPFLTTLILGNINAGLQADTFLKSSPFFKIFETTFLIKTGGVDATLTENIVWSVSFLVGTWLFINIVSIIFDNIRKKFFLLRNPVIFKTEWFVKTFASKIPQEINPEAQEELRKKMIARRVKEVLVSDPVGILSVSDTQFLIILEKIFGGKNLSEFQKELVLSKLVIVKHDDGIIRIHENTNGSVLLFDSVSQEYYEKSKSLVDISITDEEFTNKRTNHMYFNFKYKQGSEKDDAIANLAMSFGRLIPKEVKEELYEDGGYQAFNKGYCIEYRVPLNYDNLKDIINKELVRRIPV